MMGSSCSAQRRRHNQTDAAADGHGGNPRRRPQRARSGSGSCRRSVGRLRSRSFSSTVGRLCGGSQDGSSDEESMESTKCPTKRAARHSVDAEVPNQSILHLYPTDDNYQPHPTDPTRRCPKSLTDLCIDTICRSLPELEGELPPGLPQDVVDKIVASLTSHAALNSTTLRTLSKCELGSLSLANCRGVSDDWLVSLASSSNSTEGRLRSASAASYQDSCLKSTSSDFNYGTGYPSVPTSPPPLRNIDPANFVVPTLSGYNPSSSFLDVGSTSSMLMDLDDYNDGMNSGIDHSSYSGNDLQPLLPHRSSGDNNNSNRNNNDNDMQEDGPVESFDTDESRSTSSFVSASSRPQSPLLPSVLPPPEFFSLKWSSPAPGSPLWLNHPVGGSSNNALLPLPLFPQKPAAITSPTLPVRANTRYGTAGSNSGLYTGETNSLYNDETVRNDNTSYTRSSSAPVDADNTNSSTTAGLTLLDLRGSQRITDRGLLQLTPLRCLEVAKLDNCYGIAGRGLLAFSQSRMLHTLSLANCRRLTDEAVVNVGHLGGSLMYLNLGGCRCLTNRSLDALASLVGLRKLDLSQCDLITDEGLINLNDMTLLEELSLGWCRLISDDGLEILTSQPDRSRVLCTLRLARCSMTDAGLKHLELLVNLEELDLNGCTAISSAALGETLGMLTHLTSLDVSYCPGILRSSWQGKINSLKTLELCYSGVRDSHLGKLRSLPNLEELNLDSCYVADWGIAHLVDGDVMPNLKMLDLADTDISDAAMMKIASFENMRHLSLFYCNISNRGLSYLASMKNLEVLNLDSRDICDSGLRYLRGLPLTSLDLFSSRVTDLGCAYLSKIKTLTSLELCGGGISDLGCAHLATLSNLTSLNLSQNESITNRGGAALAALSNLKALNLSNTCVSSDALKYFGGLLKLQSLALYGCRDMEDSPRLDSLQSELPSLRCVRLNTASNEDGVIDHGIESEEEDDGDYEEDEEDSDFSDEEVDEEEEDERQLDGASYQPLENEGVDGSDVSSDEGSMSDFQDAYNVEIESIDTEQSQSRDMDYEM